MKPEKSGKQKGQKITLFPWYKVKLANLKSGIFGGFLSGRNKWQDWVENKLKVNNLKLTAKKKNFRLIKKTKVIGVGNWFSEKKKNTSSGYVKLEKRIYRRYFRKRISLAQFHAGGLILILVAFAAGSYATMSEIILPRIRAATETSLIVPTDVNFDRGIDSGLAGYVATGSAVLSSEVRMATSSAWWNGGYHYKKPLTLNNLSGQVLAASSSAQIMVNTKQLYDDGKLQDDCDDLRVAYNATASGDLRYEIPRSYTINSGASDCSDSTATTVTFPRQDTVWVDGSDANYEIYYGSGDAESPFEPSKHLQFDGVEDLVRLPSNVLQGQDTITLVGWINTTDENGGIFSEYSGSSHYTYKLVVADGKLKGCVGTSSSDSDCSASNYLVASANAVNDSQWHLVALAYDGEFVKIYIDGVLADSAAKTGSIDAGVMLASIGVQGYKPQSVAIPQVVGFLEGRIDEPRYYTRALSEHELMRMYAENIVPTGERVYFNFNEGSGQDVIDSSGNNTDGTLGVDDVVSDDDPVWVSDYGVGSFSVGSNLDKRATLVCPFRGSTTCVDGETPTTETGAVRYSGGSALSFDGNDNALAASSPTFNKEYSQISGEAWVYYTEIPNSTDSNFAGIWRMTGGGRFESILNYRHPQCSLNGVTVNSAEEVTQNQWQHVACTYDGSNLKVWLNGQEEGSAQASGIFNPSSGVVYVGTANRAFTQGMIDEFRLSDTVRYISNFTTSTQPFVTDENTVLLYHFDENGDDPRQVGVAIDASGNGNHGTITGAKYVSGVVGVDTDSSVVLNSTYASHEGIFIEEGTTNLILNPSFENISAYDQLWGSSHFTYATASATFTPKMAKRNSAGPFAAGPVFQGTFDHDKDSDDIDHTIGSAMPFGYETFDVNQGSIALWITPEWDGDDGKNHYFFVLSGYTVLMKADDGTLRFGKIVDGGWKWFNVDVSDWSAGETYSVVLSWDINNTLDGTNHARISIDDVHDYGVTEYGSSPSTQGFGRLGYSHFNKKQPPDAIIEGLTVYRRVLYDGTYGIDVGNGDEIAAIYNSGTGQDPTLTTGSWDVTFALPTDASTGELTTGTGEAWSHPHSSNLLGGTNGANGFMMDGTPANDGWSTLTSGKLFELATASATFTPKMAKRNGGGPFAGGVISQGNLDGTGTPDVTTYGRGSVIKDYFYDNVDPYQGSVVLFWTPEKDRDVTASDETLFMQGSYAYLRYEHDNGLLRSQILGGQSSTASLDIVAGNTYSIVLSWDTRNTIDGTNYSRISIDDSHTYSTSLNGTTSSSSTHYIGSHLSQSLPAQGIIEGLTIYRRVLYDGTNGTDVGNGDEIAAIYNSGSGADPTLSTGSWDVVFALPTNSTVGELSTGTGEAWSMPHSSAILTDTFGETAYVSSGWSDEGTPIMPTSLYNDSSSAVVNAGNGANSDNLTTGAMTVEAWYRSDDIGGGYDWPVSKQSGWYTDGWTLHMNNTGQLRGYVFAATSNATVSSSTALVEGEWTHIAMTYDDAGDRKTRVFINGVLEATSAAASGAVVQEGSADLRLMKSVSGYSDRGALGWVRISDNKRYSDAGGFTPASRFSPPANDGNTVRLFNMDEGIGATITDSSTNAQDGTLTGGVWEGADMDDDSPNERIYNWGYVFGVDAANEGITQTQSSLTAGENYVVRVVAHTDTSDDIRLRIWDETNDAQIGADYDFGASSSKDAPGVGILTFELPTIARNGAASDSTSMSVKVLGTASGQTVYVHQVEVYENLIDNPSVEGTYSGDPTIPPAWTYGGFVSGDVAKETTIVNSGQASFNFTVNAGHNKSLGYYPASWTEGSFYTLGGFVFGDSTDGLQLGVGVSSRGSLQQYLSSTTKIVSDVDSDWDIFSGVWRAGSIAPQISFIQIGAPTGDRYLDDAYWHELDPVSLTVTPASEANSIENNGLRVDGADTLTQTLSGITASSGTVRFKVTPRHDFADAGKYGESYPTLLTLDGDVDDFIKLLYIDSITLRVNAEFNGTTVNADYTTPTLNAGTEYEMEVQYNSGGSLTLKVDGTQQATQSGVVDFSTVPTTAYFGSDDVGGAQYDAVFADPDTASMTLTATADAEKVFGGGYSLTAEQWSGMYQDITVSEGDDWVIRGLVHSDGTCQPQLILYDQTNNAEIGSLYGTTTATRTDPDVLLFTGEAPTGMTTLRIKAGNAAATPSTCHWHQVEVYENLIDNPSMERVTGTPDPWIPDGWDNIGLDAGDTIQGGTSYSGTKSIGFTVGAEYEYLRQNEAVSNSYVGVGAVGYGDGTNTIGFGPGSGGSNWYQHSTASYFNDNKFSDQVAWELLHGVINRGVVDLSLLIYGQQSPSGTRYVDDVFGISLDDVSLAVTPADETNSTEASGIRVDGGDTLTQPVTGLSADRGVVKFKFTPRHDFADLDKFGNTYTDIFKAYYDTSNYLQVVNMPTFSKIELRGNFDGTYLAGVWNSPTLNAGTTYQMEIRYQSGGSISLLVDGSEVTSQTGVVDFGIVPTTAYFGTSQTGGNVYDATYTSFVTLTSEENTTAPNYKFGSKSVKLTGYDVADEYVTVATTSAQSAHTLSAYVYDGTTGNVGGDVDGLVATLASASASLTTAYEDQGGGWWRLTHTTDSALPIDTYDMGVQVQPGKTVYVDGVQLEQKRYESTYADGSLGTGYSWSGVDDESTSTRTGMGLTYPLPSGLTKSKGSASFWAYLARGWEVQPSGRNPMLFNLGSASVYVRGDGPSIWFNISGSQLRGPKLTGDQLGDKWHHIVASWDDNGKYLYLDGENYGSDAIPIPADFTSISFNSNADAGRRISDVRVFDEVLSVEEISQLYYSGLTTHSSSAESDDRYDPTSSYESPVMDLGANGSWGATPISFSHALNGGGVNYFTRTSPDNSVWSSWEAVTGNAIASAARRYIQWKAEMSSNAEQNDGPVITNMVVNYSEDTTSPENPSQAALGFSNAATPSADLVSGSWANYPNPKFTWDAATDDPDPGQSESGIDGYHMLMTTDNTASPSAELGDSCYTFAQEDSREFVVGTDPSGCSLTDNTYYLRLQTKDNSGNVADPVTIFTYPYDVTNPNAPTSVSSSQVGYTADNSFEFFWPSAADNGPAGVRGYDYKTGSTDPADPFSSWQFTSGTSVANVAAYKEGENYFFVRTVDNSGNVSAETSNLGISPFYFNSTAPTAPQNVLITPSTTEESPADENIFTVTWDKPASYSGELAKYHYCVNCTPSETAMTETTASETVNRALETLGLATQQGKNTFYIVAEDNNVDSTTGHGNRNFEAYAAVDFYASTVAPGSPQNLTISDASDRDNDLWRLTLAWEAPASGGTPAEYQIHRSEDNDSYINIGTTTVTAFTDDGLTEGTTYYYKVKAVDNAGSESVYSNVVSDAPEGKYSTPPTAGGAPSVTVGSTTAKVTWVTSRNAYGSVEYGKADSYGSSAAETEAGTSHEVRISGLAPGQTYHFRTLSLDEGEVVGYERADAYSSDYTFTTLNTPEITEVLVTDIELDSVVITWKTSSLATTIVEYGETTEYGETISVSTTADAAAHTAQLTNLKHSTTYHFRVRGTTVDEADIFSEDNEFTTQTFPKVTALLMETDQAASGTSVVLAWSTNVPTTGIVEYQGVGVDVEGLKVATNSAKLGDLIVATEEGEGVDVKKLQSLDQTQLASIPVTPVGNAEQKYSGIMQKRHLMRVGELNDGAVYVFIVRGRDKNGNEAVSEPIRYVTGADTRPPKIQNVVIETPITGVGLEAKASIIVSWDTDEPATSQLKWGIGTGTEYSNSTELELEETSKHVMVIRDLDPTTTYHIKLESADITGNLAESPDTIVVTPAAQEAAFDIILKNLEDVFGFLKL